MKKCPVCEKTFEDSMRFCQSDGTPLVEDAMPVDPYKTMVASKEEIAAAMPKPSAPEPEPKAEEILDLPAEPDPLKTMYASEDEIRREMEKNTPADNVIDLPPLTPDPPKFDEPSMSPPPSPFASPKVTSEPEPAGSPFGQTTPPIPSPFDTPKKEAADTPAPNFPAFAEPEPIVAEPSSNPFDQSSSPAVWNAPPAPDASWQNQEIGQNTPFQPPAAGTGNLNQTLAIVSLALGIISLCCYISPLTGLGALVTGFMAIKNINRDPNQYGGKTLAIVGMILGGLFFLVGVIYWVFVLFFGGMAMMMDAAR